MHRTEPASHSSADVWGREAGQGAARREKRPCVSGSIPPGHLGPPEPNLQEADGPCSALRPGWSQLTYLSCPDRTRGAPRDRTCWGAGGCLSCLDSVIPVHSERCRQSKELNSPDGRRPRQSSALQVQAARRVSAESTSDSDADLAEYLSQRVFFCILCFFSQNFCAYYYVIVPPDGIFMGAGSLADCAR